MGCGSSRYQSGSGSVKKNSNEEQELPKEANTAPSTEKKISAEDQNSLELGEDSMPKLREIDGKM